ncbi:MAG: hypothetical protein AB7O26_05440 [Planctomycetaceae bacterium]
MLERFGNQALIGFPGGADERSRPCAVLCAHRRCLTSNEWHSRTECNAAQQKRVANENTTSLQAID